MQLCCCLVCRSFSRILFRNHSPRGNQLMFWLQEAAEKGVEHAEEAEQAPIIVQLVNHYFGEWAYRFEMNYTYPLWTKFFAKFNTTPEAVFGPYTPETAIPWYTVMFVIACILSVVIIWILKGRLSED